MKRILTEYYTPRQSHTVIEEAEEKDASGRKKLYMQGIFVQGGIRNHNGRIYPVSEIRRAVENITKKLDEDVTICGEIDHPEELNINLDRITHKILKMWMDGGNGMGKLEILPTPSGNIIRTLIESGVRLGVSSRGVGNVDDQGNVSDFEMICVDIVMNPSAPDAVPKPVYEAFDTRRGRIIQDLTTAVKYDPAAQKFLHKEILGFINSIK